MKWSEAKKQLLKNPGIAYWYNFRGSGVSDSSITITKAWEYKEGV